MDNREALRRVIEHGFGAGDLSVADELPSMEMRVEDIVEDGDKVWARSVAQAPGPTPGQTLTITVPDRFALVDQLGLLRRSPPE